MSLAEEPGTEFVLGSVGRFWRKDYGGRPVTADQFVPFNEPGYAKLALGLAVRPVGAGTILRYEARTATTDESARRTFRRYWHLIAPGVGLVMRRALRRIGSAGGGVSPRSRRAILSGRSRTAKSASTTGSRRFVSRMAS